MDRHDGGGAAPTGAAPHTGDSLDERIRKAYEERPKSWMCNLAIAVVVVGLLVWSGAGATEEIGRASCRERV